jgi:hypothetical protein
MKKGPGSKRSNFDVSDSADSPIMPTRYAHESSKMIRSIEKTFYPIIGLIAALIVLAILDITDVVSKYNLLPDKTYDMIITFVATILLVAVAYLLYSLIKSRRTLHLWADVFERNSIKAGITISMSTRSKEQVLRALSETIEGIGEPLREYLSFSPDSYKNLIDVQVHKDTIFDILIDKDHLTNEIPSKVLSNIALPSKSSSATVPERQQQPSNEISDLIEATKGYGTIAAKVINGTISKETVKSFQEALQMYISSSRNKVALALIVGESIDEKADNLSKLRIKGIDYFILIEKTE